MSIPIPAEAAGHTTAAARVLARPTLFKALLLASGAIVLICSEIWMVAGALLWAVVGFLGGSVTASVVLGLPVLAVMLWATWQTVVLAVEAERNPENHVYDANPYEAQPR